MYLPPGNRTNVLLSSCLVPRFHLDAAHGTEPRALAAANAAFRLHGGVTAAAHLDSPQGAGIFTHAAGDASRRVHGGQSF